ncbi:DNA internalization-related competence protein ComEC/Rec2 [Thiomicrorhabdus sp. Milos-T2]|uniref:DNA internalization-related competence protein ComEC/Rec2 n=1 Tax=Thiomicrorhabdus sp. Milos-T2 TaxID=90814 RepID=UPI000494AF66|nr:DNA internalization-related competence protein ComEC/Rec2 [Thiomicrorhabdus sp. Milos-T2]
MFIQFIIGLLCSVILCYQLTTYLPFWNGWVGFILTLLPLLLFFLIKKLINSSSLLNSKLRAYSLSSREGGLTLVNFLFGFIVGVNIVFWQNTLSPHIDSQFYNQKALLEAKLIQSPKVSQTHHFYKLAFVAKLNRITQPHVSGFKQNTNDQAWLLIKPIIKFSWYMNKEEYLSLKKLPKTGEVWRFYAKLKSNHATLNPGARDYEAWLFQNHILAKAPISGVKIKNKSLSAITAVSALKLQDRSNWSYLVWREHLASYLSTLYGKTDNHGIYNALLIGDKTQIKDSFWQLFQQTGTIHLMAISGLHMGIMALIGFWVFKLFWWLGAYRQKLMILPTFTALGGILFATGYLIFSGGAIPTQRAWIMVVSLLAFLLIRRSFRPWYALAMAAFLVVLWDSRAVLSTGFWLSFSAVAMIFISLQFFKEKPKWQQLIAMQFMLSAGLAPLIIWSFYQVPLYGLLANLVAVPFVSFIGLPGLLLGVFLGLFSTDLAQFYFKNFDWLWSQLWTYLEWIQALPKVNVLSLQHSWIWLAFVLLALGALLSVFRYIQRRWDISAWWLIPILSFYFVALIFYPYTLERPLFDAKKHNQHAWLTVLNVGQGQSIVIETANHVVVYDTGAKWGNTTDAAKAVLLPYLKSKGWQSIDLLMISHSDIDHAGGTKSVLDNITVKQRFSGQPKEVNQLVGFDDLSKDKDAARFTQCKSDQAWWFDGIKFEVMSPYPTQTKGLKSDNDLSCVLKITNDKQSVLITGDLSQKGERILWQNYQHQTEKLQANLLVAGHHGSKHSSSTEFLQKVNPTKVVFSAGYLNRYHFPNQAVIQRLQALNPQNPIKWWNTACSGAVSFELNNFAIDLRYQARKSLHKWYHHTCLKSQQGTYYQ